MTDRPDRPDRSDRPPALGTVVEEGRGRLPFALIHGAPLVAAAGWALDEAGVTPVGAATTWAQVRASGQPYVLHDPLCPMTPPDFIAGCVDRAVASGAVVVAVREVTDTVKVRRDGLLVGTVDRAGLAVVCSPVVLPALVVAGMVAPPDPDLTRLVEGLQGAHPVERVPAPPAARRVASEDELALLAALTQPAG